jgi:hypothetical protein
MIMKKFLATAVLAVVALTGSSFAGGLTYYRLTNDPNSLRSIDVIQPPRAFHVKAVASETGMQWSSKVEGKGKLCPEGKDWLSLNDGVIHAANDGSQPSGPYVLGCKSGNAFTPSSLDVQQP